jgi:hypothetical protein
LAFKAQATNGPGAAFWVLPGRKDRGTPLALIPNDGLAITCQQFGLLGHEKNFEVRRQIA